MSVNENGKARSISAFFGQKRGTGADTALSGGPTPGAGLGTNAGAKRRSFEGILRPVMAPMSIIPYPTTAQPGEATIQPFAGQTPRKTGGPGAFEFQKPMTPVSVPRGPKKGFGVFAENREDEETPNEHAQENGIVFMGPDDETDMRARVETGIGGYMRGFGASECGGLRSGLERDIVAPVPGYALRGLVANPEEEGCEMDGIFARSSRPLGAMTEGEVGIEKVSNPQRSLGTKRGLRREDMEEGGRHTDEGHQTQRTAKRTKRVQNDPDVSDLSHFLRILGRTRL